VADLPYDTALSLIRQQTTLPFLTGHEAVSLVEDELLDREERKLRRMMRRGVISKHEFRRLQEIERR
jgi:hypothetical protein